MKIAPQRAPAHACATRIQQELSGLSPPPRSHRKRTLTRPNESTSISSPALPTTSAEWSPRTIGRGVTREGRYRTAAPSLPLSLVGTAKKSLEYPSAPPAWLTD